MYKKKCQMNSNKNYIFTFFSKIAVFYVLSDSHVQKQVTQLNRYLGRIIWETQRDSENNILFGFPGMVYFICCIRKQPTGLRPSRDDTYCSGMYAGSSLALAAEKLTIVLSACTYMRTRIIYHIEQV